VNHFSRSFNTSLSQAVGVEIVDAVVRMLLTSEKPALRICFLIRIAQGTLLNANNGVKFKKDVLEGFARLIECNFPEKQQSLIQSALLGLSSDKRLIEHFDACGLIPSIPICDLFRYDVRSISIAGNIFNLNPDCPGVLSWATTINDQNAKKFSLVNSKNLGENTNPVKSSSSLFALIGKFKKFEFRSMCNKNGVSFSIFTFFALSIYPLRGDI
jgi:hypothetical protein